MTAMEEIQAAIEKLTGLKDAANNWTSTIQPLRYWGNISGPVISHREACERYKSLEEALHRTINAQLAILQGVSTRPASTLDMREYDVQALDLARAINGSAS